MSNTLADIRLEAQEMVDELVLASTGKWSAAWWLRRINRAKDVLAQETGFNIGRTSVTLTQTTATTTLPTDLCWGILGIQLGNTELKQMDPEDSPVWFVDTSAITGTPTSYGVAHPNIYWRPIPATGTTATLIGGKLPADLTTDAGTISGLPAQFTQLIAYGAAALTEVMDLYDAPQQGRSQAFTQAFWNGAAKLNAYLDDIDKSRCGAILVSSPYAGIR